MRLSRGVDVSAHDGRLAVDLHVVVEQGVNMAAISSNLASSVKFILARIAELDDVDVRVHIEGMRGSRA
jgi:uncharacterized alkaline shock family protein YloU